MADDAEDGLEALPRLSDSYQLGMTRPQRIAVTAFLSALFVPSLFLLPVWCLKSEGMRSLLGDLSSSAPPLVTTVVAGAIPLIVFAVLCSVFAWSSQGSGADTRLSGRHKKAGSSHPAHAQMNLSID